MKNFMYTAIFGINGAATGLLLIGLLLRGLGIYVQGKLFVLALVVFIISAIWLVRHER